MIPLPNRELERRVRQAAPELPPDLLETLLNEAPESLPARPASALAPAAPRQRRPRTSWPLAASIVLVVAGGMLAWTVARQAPPLSVERGARPSATTRPPGSAPLDRAGAPATPRATLPHPGAVAVGSAQPSPPASAAPGLPAAHGPTAPRADAAPTASPVASTAAAGPEGSLVVEVKDAAGTALPGATVLVKGGPAPAIRITDQRGRASFPELAPGRYRIEAALEGFDPAEYPELATGSGREQTVAIALLPNLGETITVTSESPLLDERRIASSATVSSAELAKLPTTRGPWATLQASPGVAADRVNVGGNESSVPPGSTPPPSTGGTAEPNDQPYGDVFYRTYGVNPFVDSEDDALSTFGLDVDTGSYNVVRRYLEDGHLPPPEAVRLEELVNAFDYHDPPPAQGDFALRAEGAPSPWGPGERYHLLRLAVTARQVATEDRRPADLVFVVDVSGSMGREDRLGLVKQSLALLLGELTDADRVALVVYGSRGEVRLPFTTDRGAIAAAIDRLAPEGATNAEEGLALAYDLATREGRRDAMRRVVLCSDGVANVGRTGPESILARIGEAARQGVELTTVGFGMGNYNDVLMEQLAGQGDGRYAYVDTLEEARRIFVENLTGTLQTIATEARAQVEFDPRTVARWRLLGYENRDIADERFRDDTVDAGEIGAGHAVTALYEIKLQPGAERDRRARLGTLRLRWRPAEAETFVESELPLRRSDLAPSWGEGSRAFRLATVVARFAEALRGSFWAKDADLDRLAEDARRLAADGSAEPRESELARLIARAAELRGQAAKPAADEN